MKKSLIVRQILNNFYNKFFNKEERDETKFGYLVQHLEFPVRFYKKYNGFLGILSLKDDELYFCSKSTNEGEHTEYFKNKMPEVKVIPGKTILNEKYPYDIAYNAARVGNNIFCNKKKDLHNF